MRRFQVVLALLLEVTTVGAQTLQPPNKPTERVVVQYEALVKSGAFLNPEGWKNAAKLYARSSPYPPDGEIALMTVGGTLGEMWLKDNRAEIETKWTDYYGTIDSSLRYKPPQSPVPVVMTSFVFHLIYTNKRLEVGAHGEPKREETGSWEWKIDDPEIKRWATVARAIEYVTQMRDNSDDPVIKKNADKTIASLKRLSKPCGTASAC
jgi:hypothetical protein